MHIVVAAKQVLDPEGVNSYALWGRLDVDESGRAFTVGTVIPRIINAYDEQAMEAALRIRDSGVECRITAVTVGPAPAADALKRCVAMGADDAVHVVDAESDRANGFRTAALLAAAIRTLGSVDLVLCGRQGSDYDQGTVPGVLAEFLDAALITVAADVRTADEGIRVARVTGQGIEVVGASFPAVVSVSNEIGVARAPSARGMLDARRKKPVTYESSELLADNGGAAGAEVVRVFVPDVQGHCEMIDGDTADERASRLFAALTAAGVFHGR